MPTNFLEATGFLASAFNLLTTELNATTNGSSATSSVGGTSGVFTQTNTSSAIWGMVHFKAGGAVTPSSGGYLAGWFLYSPDSGSTFEKASSGVDQPRQPDFTIPLLNVAYASGDISPSSGLIRLPWWSFKIFLLNHSGQTLPATGNVVQMTTVAVQY